MEQPFRGLQRRVDSATAMQRQTACARWLGLKVVFDSSFLMAVIEKPTTWLEDMTWELGKVDALVPDCVIEELTKISEGEGKRSKFARLAADLAGRFRHVECSDRNVDDCVIEVARRERAAVATVDAEMIKALKRSGRKVVTLHRGRVAIA